MFTTGSRRTAAAYPDRVVTAHDFDSDKELRQVTIPNPRVDYREVTAPAPTVPAWDPAVVYDVGATAEHNGVVYRARWWTRNQKPQDPWVAWERIADCRALSPADSAQMRGCQVPPPERRATPPASERMGCALRHVAADGGPRQRGDPDIHRRGACGAPDGRPAAHRRRHGPGRPSFRC